MAALDNLNAQQFYHASPHRMARGTVMTPETNAAHGSNFEISTGNSYLTTNRQTAALMGELAASKVTNTRYEAWGKVGSPGTPPKRVSPKMYDVRPEGHIYPDENMGGKAGGHDSYETRDPVTVLGLSTSTRHPASPAHWSRSRWPTGAACASARPRCGRSSSPARPGSTPISVSHRSRH